MKKHITPVKLAILLILTGISANVNAQYVNIPDANFKAYLVGTPAINTNLNAEIEVTEAAVYSGGIFAGTQGISDLTGIEAFTNLTLLDVSQNALSSIDVSYNTALTSINVSFNSLICLDLSSNTALNSVDCSNNNLVDLNLKNGNNIILTTMNAVGAGSMLYCIQVDNVAAAGAAVGWAEDGWSTYTLSCGLPVIASIGSDAPVCCGSAITFTNGTMYANQYHWDFGDGNTSPVMAPIYTYPGTGDYLVEMIAKSCNHRDTAYINLSQGMDIYGYAGYSGGAVTSGTAILYGDVPFFTAFDTLAIDTLDASGNFQFNNFSQGNYLIKVIPDTIAFPTLSPTYYLSHWAWDSCNIFLQDCVLDGFPTVTMVEYTPMIPNIGWAQGFVLEGPGFGRAQGDPIHGVDVKLGITGTTNIVASTTTDNNGTFSFGNIGFGNYTVFVDVAGLYRDSVYAFTVDASTNQFPNLYHLVDSVKIYIVPGIGIEDFGSSSINKMDVFPNPTRGNVTINYKLSTDANVQLDVCNLLGIKVQSLVSAHQMSGEYSYNFNPLNSNLKSGVYFISLSANGKGKTKRFIFIE